MHSLKRLLAGGLTGGAALALAACGASSPAGPTPAQIAAAAKSATSVRVTGSLNENGTPETLNLGMFTSGDLTGTLTTSGQPAITLMVVNKSAYVLVTPAFLKSSVGSSASCNGQCGKYIKVTGAQASSLTSGLSLSGLLKSFGDLRGAQAPVGTTTVNGEKALVFKDTGDDATLDVAANGPPYPLRLAGKSGSTTATIVFSDWNKVPAPTAPPAGDLVDPAKL